MKYLILEIRKLKKKKKKKEAKTHQQTAKTLRKLLIANG